LPSGDSAGPAYVNTTPGTFEPASRATDRRVMSFSSRARRRAGAALALRGTRGRGTELEPAATASVSADRRRFRIDAPNPPWLHAENPKMFYEIANAFLK